MHLATTSAIYCNFPAGTLIRTFKFVRYIEDLAGIRYKGVRYIGVPL